MFQSLSFLAVDVSKERQRRCGIDSSLSVQGNDDTMHTFDGFRVLDGYFDGEIIAWQATCFKQLDSGSYCLVVNGTTAAVPAIALVMLWRLGGFGRGWYRSQPEA